MNYASKVETEFGVLTITATQTSKEGDTLAVFIDSTGHWTREFPTYAEFKQYLTTLRIKNILMMSENNGRKFN